MQSLRDRFEILGKDMMGKANSRKGEVLSEIERTILQTLPKDCPRYNRVLEVIIKRWEKTLEDNGKACLLGTDSAVTLPEPTPPCGPEKQGVAVPHVSPVRLSMEVTRASGLLEGVDEDVGDGIIDLVDHIDAEVQCLDDAAWQVVPAMEPCRAPVNSESGGAHAT